MTTRHSKNSKNNLKIENKAEKEVKNVFDNHVNDVKAKIVLKDQKKIRLKKRPDHDVKMLDLEENQSPNNSEDESTEEEEELVLSDEESSDELPEPDVELINDKYIEDDSSSEGEVYDEGVTESSSSEESDTDSDIDESYNFKSYVRSSAKRFFQPDQKT